MQQRSARSARGEVFSPPQRESSSSAGLAEPVTAWVEGWNRTMTNMYDTWVQAVQAGWQPYLPQPVREAPSRGEQRSRHECACAEHGRECGCDGGCTCNCCVGDVDLVINSRIGERRVVPILIENNSRRERDVEIELSDWTARGGQTGAKVTGVFVSPLKFTIPACAEETLTLVVSSTLNDAANNQLNLDNALAQEANAPGANRLGDVDTCRIFTADLRVKGCDMRAVRIAVALLPRDCDPFVIDCRCGCC